MTFCRAPFSFTTLELATGLVFGTERFDTPAPRDGDPIPALEAAILPAVAGEGPCVVSFSGGRDSSAVLAVAVQLARREGLPLPIPATNVFPGAAKAEETRWQEEIVRHLGLTEWARLEHDDLDAVGPVALDHLTRHGLLWPFNAHFHAPLLRLARGGVLLTGIGGDELLGSSEQARAAAVLARAVRPTPRDVLRVGLALAPYVVRRSALRPRAQALSRLEWLTDAGRAQLAREVASSLASEPLRWSSRWAWWRRQRDTAVGLASLDLIARDCGAAIRHPLTDAGFATAAARLASGRVYDRAELTARLFGGLLPGSVVRRTSKASFDAVFFGEASRALAASALDEAASLELVARDGLRAAWARDVPDSHTLLLLQAIAVRRADAAGKPDHVASCRP